MAWMTLTRFLLSITITEINNSSIAFPVALLISFYRCYNSQIAENTQLLGSRYMVTGSEAWSLCLVTIAAYDK